MTERADAVEALLLVLELALLGKAHSVNNSISNPIPRFHLKII